MISFGVNRSEFRQSYFEQRPMLVRSAFDSSPFGWHTIDRALDLQDPTRELIKVLHGGRVDPTTYVEEYVDIGIRRRRILKDRLYDHMASGATLVLNRMELVSPEVRDVCMEVGRLVGAQTTSNAYACLGGEPATNVHWDTHDVFVVQIGGHKHWKIYEPTHLLPVSSQVSNNRKDEVPADPIIDEVLSAGDVLYVPRGWWHRVAPVSGSDTLHLTVAIHTPLVLDFLVWACGSVLPDLLEVRYSLFGAEGDKQRVAEAMTVVSDVLRRPEVIEAFYARSRQRERVVSRFDIANLLERTEGMLPSGSRFILNSRSAGTVDSTVDVNGRHLPLSGNHLDVVRKLSATTAVSADALSRSLSSISAESLDRVLRDLLRADVIQREPVTAELDSASALAG